jgi:hypothetical protein
VNAEFRFDDMPLPWMHSLSSDRNSQGKGIYEVKPIYTLLLVSFLMAHPGAAQSTPDTTPPAPKKSASASVIDSDTTSVGPTAFAFVAGDHFNMGTVLSYNLNLGYNFTAKLGVDAGFNIVSTRTPFSLITTADWRDTTILGSPYVDVRYNTVHHGINLTTVVTGQGGLSSVRTYSNGRFVGDLFNHAYRTYLIFPETLSVTPFLNFGFSNGTVDRAVLATPYDVARPYETLGAIGNGEIGLTFTVFKNYKLSGSIYGLAPAGPQKVFSKLVSPDSLLGDTTGAHNRFWDEDFLTEGPSRIDRDSGGAVWLDVAHYKHVTVELAYTRSVHYDYGSAFIMIKYDLTSILRSLTIGE